MQLFYENIFYMPGNCLLSVVCVGFVFGEELANGKDCGKIGR
jgi:hypothetical protein